MNKKIVLPVMICTRCGHEWIPRKEKPPVTCPECCSPYWNIPRLGDRKVAKQREYAESACKTEGCKYNNKFIPRKLWVMGDGIWQCPECGYGIATVEKENKS